MNIAIFDQNHFYANGMKVLINEFLSQSATITINERSLLSNAHLIIRTPDLSSWEEWQNGFNHPQTLYIYHRPLPAGPHRRDNALYRGDPLGITLSTLKQHLHRCPDEETPPPSINRLLSDTEIQVLKLIKIGMSDRVIAAHCRLRTKTVSLMRCNAIKKMGLHNRLELYQLLSKLHF